MVPIEQKSEEAQEIYKNFGNNLLGKTFDTKVWKIFYNFRPMYFKLPKVAH